MGWLSKPSFIRITLAISQVDDSSNNQHIAGNNINMDNYCRAKPKDIGKFFFLSLEYETKVYIYYRDQKVIWAKIWWWIFK